MALEFSTQANNLPLKLRLLKTGVALMSRIAPSYVAQYGFDMFITPKRRPIKQSQRDFLATGERFTIPYHDEKLTAYRWGEGKPVLLVHGWQSNAATMTPFVEPLLEKGYQVIAMDAPAHGDSPGTQLDLIQYGDAILSAINMHRGLHALIAHSIGATAVATMLGTHKHYRIDKTVLIAAVDTMPNMLQMYANGFGLTDSVQKAMDKIIEKWLGNPPNYFSNPDLLEDYPHPLMIVHDKDDKMIPYEAGVNIATKAKPTAFLTTEGLGHRLILRDKATIDKIVNFVD